MYITHSFPQRTGFFRCSKIQMFIYERGTELVVSAIMTPINLIPTIKPVWDVYVYVYPYIYIVLYFYNLIGTIWERKCNQFIKEQISFQYTKYFIY